MTGKEAATKYGSRKFIVTVLTILSTVLLAYIGKMDAQVAMVFSACVVGYHMANAYTTGKGGEA